MKLFEITDPIDLDAIKSQPFFDVFDELRLYTGKSKKISDIIKLDFRYRKTPSNTIIEFHDKVNKFAMEKFNIPIRNLMFSYTNDESVQSYGHPNMIVPIGNNFKIFSNLNYHDMTMDLDIDSLDNIDISGFMPLAMKLYNDKVDKDLYEELMSKLFLETPVTGNDRDYFDEFVDDVIDNNPDDEEKIVIFSQFIRKIKEKLINIINHAIDEELNNMAKDYVEGVEIITDDEDIHSEMMIYAPDGMYIIPSEYFDLIS